MSQQIFSQVYPTFGNEKEVTITGLTFDAMEPSISSDGNFLFFNSLNNGTTTSLYYATKVNDTTFTYAGALTGANQTITPRLDAVASTDSANNFYWVSTRDFPTQFDNFHHGKFNGTDVVNIGRIHGNFYIYTLGWLIMDAAINYKGDMLYYCNAYFNPSYTGCAGIPCQAKLGIAHKLNDTIFSKLSNSDGILNNVNDTNYLVYAPTVTTNELELYFTRILRSNPTISEICVSVRTSITDSFSVPQIIYSSTLIPEAATLTTDRLKMYYHKFSSSLHKIFLRYRTSPTNINEKKNNDKITIYPNPSNSLVYINLPNSKQNFTIELYSTLGELILKTTDKTVLDISNFTNGIYLLKVRQANNSFTTKIVKQ